MLENRNELDVIASRLPYLYDIFEKIDEKGIKILVKCEAEAIFESIPKLAIQEIVEYLVDKTIANLKRVKAPVIFFLLYEKNGLCMEIAHTGRKKYVWTRWLIERHLMKVYQKYKNGNREIKYCMVEMNFKGRDCICHNIRF